MKTVTFCQDRPAPNTEKQTQETEKFWLLHSKCENNIHVKTNARFSVIMK